MPDLPILHQADGLVAINKPHGLLVHRSFIAADASEFAVQLLRDQLGQRVYPVIGSTAKRVVYCFSP